MIVSCPECRTLYHHRPSPRRSARCGACHAEISLPAARTYLVGTVERAGRSAARSPEPAPALAGLRERIVDANPARGAAARVRPEPVGRAAPAAAPWPEPASTRLEREEADLPPESSVDRSLDEMARRARSVRAVDDATVRNVIFGIGVGAIAGVAFSPGLFDAAWVSWAVGGAMGGLAAALWSRAWGLRRA